MTKPQRIPEPNVNALRRQFPRLLLGEIEGDDIYLVMADDRGRPHEAVHYVATPNFMTAVRVCNSGGDNFEMLCGEIGFEMTLLAPRSLRPSAQGKCAFWG
jgi:hypothetical protein